jgi:hypothetical protein
MSDYTILAYDRERQLAYLGDAEGRIVTVTYAYLEHVLADAVIGDAVLTPADTKGVFYLAGGLTVGITQQYFTQAGGTCIRYGFDRALRQWFLWADKHPEK